MPSDFLLYGASGYLGHAIARSAAAGDLRPLLAGRDASKLKPLAAELNLPFLSLSLTDAAALDAALSDVAVVLNCAGPFVHTFQPVVDACLRTGTHYLDITGEIPVYEAIAACNAQARQRGVMLMPGVGFDIVPTDCLAAYLKQRLPSATSLRIGWAPEGPAVFPPGTLRTLLELAYYGNRVRRNGLIVPAPGTAYATMDFGRGPTQAVRWTWGDIFSAYYSTGIVNIEDYVSMPKLGRQFLRMQATLRPLLRLSFFRELLMRRVPTASTPEELAQSRVDVYGEVSDEKGARAVARLHGPEAGVIWTTRSALLVVRKVLGGDFKPGYMTPALAYGPGLVLECEGVTREDVA